MTPGRQYRTAREPWLALAALLILPLALVALGAMAGCVVYASIAPPAQPAPAAARPDCSSTTTPDAPERVRRLREGVR